MATFRECLACLRTARVLLNDFRNGVEWNEEGVGGGYANDEILMT